GGKMARGRGRFCRGGCRRRVADGRPRRMGTGAGMRGAAVRSDPAPDARGNGIRRGRRTPASGFPGNHPRHDSSRERRARRGQRMAQACRAADRQSNGEQGTWALV
ncbi:hypothetical protein EN812_34175, partial [Mesorhizobium sp. M4B.F.Ca.ET.169.01.1.1]